MELVILIGAPGSGKSTYCKEQLAGYLRISQDEQGKDGHRKVYQDALAARVPYIVIDRMNHVEYQRERYAKPAREAGYSVRYVRFKESFEVCLQRIVARENHPTIKDEATARLALGTFFREVDDPFFNP